MLKLQIGDTAVETHHTDGELIAAEIADVGKKYSRLQRTSGWYLNYSNISVDSRGQ